MGLFGDADFVMTRDVAYTRSLQYLINNVAIDWTGYSWVCQVRDYYGALWFDLTPYLSVDSVDHTKLNLVVPKEQVQNILHDSRWDLVATKTADGSRFRTPDPPGRVLVLAGITDVA